jgi:hypothetical protein
MNQFESNQIKSRLRRLELSEEFIDRYMHKLQINCESYRMACKTIDQWQKQDSREVVSQVLVCGIIAAVFGGFLATL